jgi:hypothetical protein
MKYWTVQRSYVVAAPSEDRLRELWAEYVYADSRDETDVQCILNLNEAGEYTYPLVGLMGEIMAALEEGELIDSPLWGDTDDECDVDRDTMYGYEHSTAIVREADSPDLF